MRQQTSEKISIFSFIFTMIIVGYHTNIVYMEYYHFDFLRYITSNLWEYFANIAMSYFFMTTGYLLYNNASSKNIILKLKRRIYSIIIPFLTWNLLYYSISVFLRGNRDNIITVIYRFSFDPYDGPLWYLFAITLLSLLSPTVLKLKDKKWFKLAITTIGFFATLIYGFHLLKVFNNSSKLHIISWIERLIRYLPSYIIGSYLALSNSIYKKVNRLQNKFFIIFIVFTSLFWIISGFYFHDFFKVYTLLITPLCIWMIYNKQYNHPARWMRNSFIIYAIHRLFLTTLSIIENKFHIVSEIKNIYLEDIFLLFLPILCCIVIWIFVDCLTKILRTLHLNFVLRILSGGRK